MKVKFWGAAQTVTGSQHLLELDNGRRILLDCGLYQGRESFADEYNTEFSAPAHTIDYLVLSHAHIDHCGNIPQLVKSGFNGPIYCTPATYDLATILLKDSAMIQEKDAEYENKHRKRRGLPEVEPFYTKKDVDPALNLFKTIPYEKWQKIDDDIEVLFRDAGHILGSASVTLKIKEDGREIMLGFTGDIGRPNRQILEDPKPMPEVDYLICESTYGGKIHELNPQAEDHLFRIFHKTCVEGKGKLIIPAFSVGRTQDIVHSLDKLENEGKIPKSIPVYVDSPLAVNATDIFKAHPECFDDDLVEYMRTDPNPFGFNNLHYIRSVEESKKLNRREGPCVIISASGMITAGRILHHVRNNIEDVRNTILLVGYCAKGSIGSRLASGEDKVRIFGETYKVKAQIEKLHAFSAHGDQEEMGAFIENQKGAKQIWLVHGDPNRSEKMRDWLQDRGFGKVDIPLRGEQFVI